jgi:hypothetical protein
MSHNSSVLFQNLLDDFTDYVDSDTLSRLRAGVVVEPWSGISPAEYACITLAKTFYKKFVDDVADDADARALEKFLAVNARCGAWTDLSNVSHDEILMGELRASLHRFWFKDGEPLVSDENQIWSELRCGPGASLNAVSYDFYSKLFGSPLSVTNDAIYRSYRGYIAQIPTWSAAESFRADHYGCCKVVGGNRLSFVPKQRDISRIICVEPTLNMSGQLGLGEILSRRLREVYGIDLSRQPERNRELARVGSLLEVFSTIDLSSASDSLSLKMLRAVMPPDFLWWLEQFRSPTTTLPDGKLVELEMVSTMGNGYTFPLQTILFSCIVSAAARSRGKRLWWPRADSSGAVGVFGDDLVIPTHFHYFPNGSCESYGVELVRDVLRLLELLGFVVNAEKTFLEGPFRESCGGDYFVGHYVRGVYIKTLKTMESRFVAINRLNHWSAMTGIVLNRTVRFLLKSTRFQPVPLWENDDAGVRVPLSYLKRYRTCQHLQSILYRRSLVKPRYLQVGDGVILGKRGLIYNPMGLLTSLLNGTVRDGRIGIRNSANTYYQKTGIAPNWEHCLTVLGHSPSGPQLSAAVTANIR